MMLKRSLHSSSNKRQTSNVIIMKREGKEDRMTWNGEILGGGKGGEGGRDGGGGALVDAVSSGTVAGESGVDWLCFVLKQNEARAESTCKRVN